MTLPESYQVQCELKCCDNCDKCDVDHCNLDSHYCDLHGEYVEAMGVCGDYVRAP